MTSPTAAAAPPASPLTQFFTAVNFVLGAGVLGLPYAVSSAGIFASMLALVLMASLSMLTCSWLLEVGDRANAIQNELSRGGDGAGGGDKAASNTTTVHHEDGAISHLPPPADFLHAGLRAPLLLTQKSAQKLDEYRAAYRSWRTGSHQGATDTQLRQLRPHLVYTTGRHRALLPLQLLPTALAGSGGGDAEDAALPDEASSMEAEGEDEVSICESAAGAVDRPLSASACSSGGNSTHSLDGLMSSPYRGAALSLPKGLAAPKVAGGGRQRSRRPSTEGRPTIQRQSSFSEDLANALLQLPSEHFAVAPDVTEPTNAPAYTPPVVPARSDQGSVTTTVAAAPPPRAQRSTQALAPAPVPLPTCAPGGGARPDWSVPDEITALEVTQLCNVFLGPRYRDGWILAICLLHFSAMWACCAVWVTCAQAALAPIFGGSDGVVADGVAPWVTGAPCLITLCAMVLVPLSTVGGAESLQPPLATATLTTLTLMSLVLLWALSARVVGRVEGHGGASGRPVIFAPPMTTGDDGGGGGGGSTGGAASDANGHYGDDDWFRLLVFNEHGFGPSFATFLFSYILQQSVPSLTRNAAIPTMTRTAIAAALCTCCGLYVVLGCTAAALFGRDTQPLVTLHFADFRGGAPIGAPPPLWATVVSRWVMLLPLVTTTAAFPLFNRVLAANLLGLLPRRLRSRHVAATLCALPPFICTACLHDTALVFAISGLSGFAAVFFVPSLLQRAALRASVRRWGELGRHTPHSTALSSERVVLAVLLFSGGAFAQNLMSVVSKMTSPQ